MLDTVYARERLLEYLATSCAITHEIALNGIRMPFFRQFQ
ncbi:RAxF-45 family protein [Sporosarcina oncorhynchi]|uniref:RAxF-45 family protein n=1 Tax=Sporosarcina oncorhynchi TaxID=3056444 RepID=A0ABZ0L5N3_9BACL|nr:RAxF-45 family protein [Sporosarcina sp. T2O-4]WOV87880.1 RAxF-45 family protein [Sporosarcina sp. T2O-4]